MLHCRDVRNYHDATDWLKTWDRNLAVGDWAVGDIHIWPLVRAMLGYRLHERIRMLAEETALPDPGSPTLDRLREVQAAHVQHRTWGWREHISRREAEAARIEPGDHELLNANRIPVPLMRQDAHARWLFVSNTSLDQIVDGRPINRLFHEICRLAEAMGVATRQLVSTAVTPAFLAARPGLAGMANSLWHMRRAGRSGGLAVATPGLEELIADTADSPHGSLLAPAEVEAAASNLHAYVGHFEQLVRAERIDAVFVVPYYTLLGTALCAAARRAHIPCVDVQHGVIGPPNPHYDFAGETALNTVPTHIWLTADRTIARPRLGGACRSFFGGNPTFALVERLRATHPDWAPAPAARDGRRNILVTLARGRVPSWLADVVRDAPLEWRWWLRLHPSDYVKGIRGESVFAALAQRPNIEIEEANRVPLPILLERADVHVTKSSSTAVEAREFGIATLFYDRDGHHYYSRLPGADADRLVTPEHVCEAIDATRSPSARPSVLVGHRKRVDRVVRELARGNIRRRLDDLAKRAFDSGAWATDSGRNRIPTPSSTA